VKVNRNNKQTDFNFIFCRILKRFGFESFLWMLLSCVAKFCPMHALPAFFCVYDRVAKSKNNKCPSLIIISFKKAKSVKMKKGQIILQ
jgi:hypothetical protein